MDAARQLPHPEQVIEAMGDKRLVRVHVGTADTAPFVKSMARHGFRVFDTTKFGQDTTILFYHEIPYSQIVTFDAYILGADPCVEAVREALGTSDMVCATSMCPSTSLFLTGRLCRAGLSEFCASQRHFIYDYEKTFEYN
jgi:hypothetical protein